MEGESDLAVFTADDAAFILCELDQIPHLVGTTDVRVQTLHSQGRTAD